MRRAPGPAVIVEIAAGEGPAFCAYWVRSHERKIDIVEVRIVHRNNVPGEANFYINV